MNSLGYGDYHGGPSFSGQRHRQRQQPNGRQQRRTAGTSRQRQRYRRPTEPLLFRHMGPMSTRRKNVVLLTALVGILVAWFLTPLSEIVAAYVLLTVPVESDIELGRESLKALQRKYPPVTDRWNVERIGWDLVQSLDDSASTPGHAGYRWGEGAWSTEQRRSYKWDFKVVKADFANAFALPGGIVRVTDALLRQLKLSDAEIAALVGHEMGHVLHRHSQKRQVKNQLFGTVLNAVIYEDHDGYDETFGEAVSEILLKGASWLGEQSFSRRDEYEADATAWEVLVASERYDPRAVQGMLGKLWSLEGGEGKTRWESTHPGTADRIQALSQKWEGLSKTERKILDSYPVS